MKKCLILILILSSQAFASPRYLSRTGSDGASYGLRLEIDSIGTLLHVESAELLKLLGAGTEGRERFLAASTPGQVALENLFRLLLDENDHVSQMGGRAKIGNPSAETVLQGRLLAVSSYLQLQIKKPQVRWAFDDEALLKSLRPSASDGPHTLVNHALLSLIFTHLRDSPLENPTQVIDQLGVVRKQAVARALKDGISDPEKIVDSLYTASPISVALSRANLEVAAKKIDPTLSQPFIRDLDRAFQKAKVGQDWQHAEKLWQDFQEAGSNIVEAQRGTLGNAALGFQFQQIPRDLAMNRFGDESKFGSHGFGYVATSAKNMHGHHYDSIGEAAVYLGAGLSFPESRPRYRSELPDGSKALPGELQKMAEQGLANLSQWDEEVGSRKRTPIDRLTTIFVALSAMAPFEKASTFDRNALTAELVLNNLARQEGLPPIAFDSIKTDQVQAEIRKLAEAYRTNKLDVNAPPTQVQGLYKAASDLILEGMAKGVQIHSVRNIIHQPPGFCDFEALTRSRGK